MKISKWVIVVVFLGFLVAFIGLGSRLGGVYYEDTNGASDYSLQTITDENIIKTDIQATGLVVNCDANGNESYMSTSFSGVQSVYLEEKNGENVEITVDYLNVKKGNFKMAVVVNEQIVHVFNINEPKQSYSAQGINGEIQLTVAGESAHCDFDFTVN